MFANKLKILGLSNRDAINLLAVSHSSFFEYKNGSTLTPFYIESHLNTLIFLQTHSPDLYAKLLVSIDDP